jgi:hypothetical protein
MLGQNASRGLVQLEGKEGGQGRVSHYANQVSETEMRGGGREIMMHEYICILTGLLKV